MIANGVRHRRIMLATSHAKWRRACARPCKDAHACTPGINLPCMGHRGLGPVTSFRLRAPAPSAKASACRLRPTPQPPRGHPHLHRDAAACTCTRPITPDQFKNAPHDPPTKAHPNPTPEGLLGARINRFSIRAANRGAGTVGRGLQGKCTQLVRESPRRLRWPLGDDVRMRVCKSTPAAQNLESRSIWHVHRIFHAADEARPLLCTPGVGARASRPAPHFRGDAFGPGELMRQSESLHAQ